MVLGIDDRAQLNIGGGNPSVTGITTVGMRYLPGGAGTTEYEVTSHGCLCEGWGVSASGGSGYANNSLGTAGLSADSFVSTASTATVVTTAAAAGLKVTHSFALSGATNKLYELVVTIENIGAGAATDVTYRRTMDWDTDPTPFNEFVTIGGSAAATAVKSANNNGFCSSNPLAACNQLFAGGTGDFVDLGPADHGSNFDFGFGDLAAGDSVTFSIFYGGADSVADAFTVMGAVGIEVFSLGRSGTDVNGDGLRDSDGALTPTYIFGFSGVGGTPVVPTPEPGTIFLLGAGLLGLGLQRRRRRV